MSGSAAVCDWDGGRSEPALFVAAPYRRTEGEPLVAEPQEQAAGERCAGERPAGVQHSSRRRE